MNKSMLKDKIWGIWCGLPHSRINQTRAHEAARKKLTCDMEDASIMAVNCVGGEISNALGLRFNSPLINTSMKRNDFVKLVCDLEEYMNSEVTYSMVNGEVIASIKDITIRFVHDDDISSAKAGFERRKSRINYDKLILILDDQGLSEDNLKKFNDIKCFRKICLTSSRELADKYPCCFLMEEYEGEPQVGKYQYKDISGLHHFEKTWDYVSFLNEQMNLV